MTARSRKRTERRQPHVIAGATPRGPAWALVWRGGGGESGREDASGGDGGQRLQFQKAAGSVREPGARGSAAGWGGRVGAVSRVTGRAAACWERIPDSSRPSSWP